MLDDMKRVLRMLAVVSIVGGLFVGAVAWLIFNLFWGLLASVLFALPAAPMMALYVICGYLNGVNHRLSQVEQHLEAQRKALDERERHMAHAQHASEGSHQT